ncbi:Protein LURP-one-related 15 [Dichanthelium oligosanthes]|uniref:Protein LURP-one-related 15 n=1 Tax=Dichanthelium oligosanthes TaxID=888268 RepID=A0A1E5W2N4_9POAL|nr:Protein LURP-one-related 15 [Dichanthelium oligosanthes]
MAAPYYGAPQMSPVPAPVPVAVVSPQFCAPYAVPLTVVKKALSLSGGDFVITDANGAEMLRVKGAVFSVHDRRVLHDAGGQPLVSMREKVLSMHNRCEVFRGDSTNASDLLFTVKKTSVLQLRTEVDVFLAGNTAQQVSDFKIRGSYFERSCNFYLGHSDTMIAQITRKYTPSNVLLGKDTFLVTVFPHVDYRHAEASKNTRRRSNPPLPRRRSPMAAPYAYGAPPPPAAAAAPAPVAVVSPQFCAPYVVPLTVTKKAISLSDGDFTVTDANGAVVLRVKGAIFNVRHRRVLLDAAGQPILSMQEKVFSMHNRWEVFRGDSSNASDLLFTAKKSSIIQLKTQMDIFLASNTAEQVCDFKIKGSYFERSCAFYLGNSNNMIAQMNRQFTVSNVLLGKDTFGVTVFPHVDYVFIAALVVILDEIHRERGD